MTPEVRAWVEEVIEREKPKAPVLEVGALDVNGTVRDLFKGEYVGLDQRAGAGVDLVADVLTLDLLIDGQPHHSNFNKRFATVLCLETLEHISEPWIAIENMHRSLKSGGLFAGSWVFEWALHNEPDDYWRTTTSGFRHLLERVGFVDINVELHADRHVYATARKA